MLYTNKQSSVLLQIGVFQLTKPLLACKRGSWAEIWPAVMCKLPGRCSLFIKMGRYIYIWSLHIFDSSFLNSLCANLSFEPEPHQSIVTHKHHYIFKSRHSMQHCFHAESWPLLKTQLLSLQSLQSGHPGATWTDLECLALSSHRHPCLPKMKYSLIA